MWRLFHVCSIHSFRKYWTVCVFRISNCSLSWRTDRNGLISLHVGAYYYYYYLLNCLLTYLLTAIEFSPGGSSSYTSTDKTNKNKIYIKDTVQKHSTNNKKYSKKVHILPKHAHIKNTHTHPHITKQVETTAIQDTHQRNRHNAFKYPQYMVKFHRCSLHCISLRNKITSCKSRRFTQRHFTPRHFTYLPFACNYILNPLSKNV